MTYEQRNEMFAKDYLSIADMQTLFDLSYNSAASMMRDIKRKYDRLHIQGKIHVQDYIDYYGLDTSRYQPQTKSIPIQQGVNHGATGN